MRFVAFFTSGKVYEFDDRLKTVDETVPQFAAKKLQLAIDNGLLEEHQINDGYVEVIDFEENKSYFIEFEAYFIPVVRVNSVVNEKNKVPNYAEKYR